MSQSKTPFKIHSHYIRKSLHTENRYTLLGELPTTTHVLVNELPSPHKGDPSQPINKIVKRGKKYIFHILREHTKILALT